MTTFLLPTATWTSSSRDEITARLERAFGSPFAFWAATAEAPQPVDGHAPAETEVDDLRELVAAALAGRQPQLAPAGDEITLAIPLAACGARDVVAVARFGEITQAALLRQARLFLEAATAHTENRKLAEVNTSLTLQVTESFEEMVFLRTMSNQLVLAKAVRFNEIIRTILPHLCSTLRAESLVLVVPDETKSTVIGDRVVWGGKRLCDQQALQLCSKLTLHRHESTIIENSFQTTVEWAGEFPDVRGLIGVEVGDGAEWGWLFAINRVLSNGFQPSHWTVSEQQFGTVEAALLTSAAAMMATHLNNAELLAQKEQLFTEIVRALVNAVEARDPYTRGHSERVALYSRRLGQQVGMDYESRERLYLSGLLHDVGKIAVSDATLQKAGRLTDDEYREISSHPVEGWAILSDLEHLRGIMPGVLYHHERFDGKGYPDGLAAEQIPLEARIMAICDAYDAMTSNRPYRNGMPQEKAEAILRSGAGDQWDPALIDAFFAIMPDILRIRDSYRPREPKRRQEEKG